MHTMLDSETIGLLDDCPRLGMIQSSYRPDKIWTVEDIARALAHPIWPAGRTEALFDIPQPGQTIGLVVSDHTRKTAADRILPVLLDGLRSAGCHIRDMFILFASGIHRPPAPPEIERILGSQVVRQFEGRVHFHDPDDPRMLVSIGTTRRGHQVRINRRAAEANCLILLGAATYHYHAGFGGGRKSLVPGLAARDTIAYNHSLTLDPVIDQIHPNVRIGVMDGNPVAEEIQEAALLHPPAFVVNAVLMPDGRLAGLFAGDMLLAHQEACEQVEKIARVDLPEAADLVIASAEPALNWIQSHKALFNASRAIHARGRIILLAPCPEGIGDEGFRHWVTRPTLSAIYSGLRQNPDVLGQTALSTRIRGQQTILVSPMPARDLRDLGIAAAPDLSSAIRQARCALAETGIARPRYCLMPQALSVVPFVKRS